MPLPPESDSQCGSGTGQIWVTSSRPISSGGSRRPDAEAWPSWAATQWISVAMAANSGGDGSLFGDGFGDQVHGAGVVEEGGNVEPVAGTREDARRPGRGRP